MKSDESSFYFSLQEGMLIDSTYAPTNRRFVGYSRPEEVWLERMGTAEDICVQEMWVNCAMHRSKGAR